MNNLFYKNEKYKYYFYFKISYSYKNYILFIKLIKTHNEYLLLYNFIEISVSNF